MNKRTFLKQITAASLATTPVFAAANSLTSHQNFLSKIDELVDKYKDLSPEQLAKNEDFWLGIRSGYRLKPDYINLENGYYCISPSSTLEKHLDHVRMMNYEGSWYMRTVKESNKKAVEAELAQLINGKPNEVGITRNTTESMDIIIGGYPWQAGDEAIMATEDYGSMVQMFKQVAKRYGVVNKVVSVPRHPKSDEEIVKVYEDAITPKTKLLMVCHIINVTGHILPIRKICDMAHRKGVEVMVDGAHAVGHFPVDVKALDCDYYGSSLHKWLSAPIGTGLLYVKQEKIKKIYPRFAGYSEGNPEDISYLNHTGTNPVHINLGVLDAIEYLTRLGLERKTARLRYLQHLWTDAVRDLPNIKIHTPKDEKRSCAIASVIVKGMNPKDMAKHLLKKYRIWTVGFTVGNINGCRITPNIYTTKKEIEVFVKALKEMAA